MEKLKLQIKELITKATNAYSNITKLNKNIDGSSFNLSLIDQVMLTMIILRQKINFLGDTLKNDKDFSEKIGTELSYRNNVKGASADTTFKKDTDLQLREKLVNLNVKISKMLRAKATYEAQLEDNQKQFISLILKQFN